MATTTRVTSAPPVPGSRLVDVGVSLNDLPDGGHRVVTVAQTPIMLWRTGDIVHAMDSRCPHMGYPLTKGTVEAGILRCHWHHWRFDLASGGCFTAGGDDVPTYDVAIDEAGRISVGAAPRGATADTQRQHAWTRLEEGLRENRSFLRVRSLVTLMGQGATPAEVASRATRLALLYSRSGVSTGLVVLASVLNVLDATALTPEEQVLGLAHSLGHIAGDISARSPKRPEMGLPEPLPTRDQLAVWFQEFLEERETAGAERCLRTLLEDPDAIEEALTWLLQAATRHVFLSTGHVLDFLNKTRELTHHLSGDPATVTEVLVGMLTPIADGFRHEEDLDWQDLLPLLAEAERAPSQAPTLSVAVLLGDDPHALTQAMAGAFFGGTPVVELARLQAEAAIRRLGRFPVANADDWDTVHHLVTNANGVLGLAEALGGRDRDTDRALYRAVMHSALYGYLNRFLNMPRHYLPGENRPVRPDGDPDTIRDHWMAAMANGQTDDAAWRAAELLMSQPADSVAATWVRAVWREDQGFHAMQALDAALSLERRLANRLDGHWPLLAGTRFTTAQRDRRLVQWETDTAFKLARGEQLVDPE
ncbi:MAG: Rieske (2Fe-2S) protein [Thermaerobacter sp.]|nr:Rieske (2Fe-2S) protein [Thermaerobacter sp.]